MIVDGSYEHISELIFVAVPSSLTPHKEYLSHTARKYTVLELPDRQTRSDDTH